MTPIAQLRAAVEAAAGGLTNGGGAPRSRPTLERPKQAGHGDYATNAALVLAPVVGAPPRDVAARLGDALAERLGPALDRVEVAGPGFLNLFLADAWYAAAVDWVLEAGDAFGALTPERAERVNLEFVSANPTGPLTAASGRHAAYGDALGRILSLAGHSVEREYYFNDEGAQVRRLAESIRARARGDEPPEDGYQGDYVKELADAIPGAADMDLDALAERGVELVVARIRATLDAYRVTYDRWFTERTLHEGSPSAIDRALARLEEQGHLYRSEGALWLRTTTFGDDKDRVLIRSTGEPTYFAADVAYHEEKLERGYDRLINVLGSDHHGYVARMKAAMAALGADPDRLEIPLLQFVHIVEGGSRASMSKRRGDFITLDELIGEIGVDATRWFMLSRSQDSTVDLDLELAKRESSENPVYYVQYAHARINSVLGKAGEERVAAALKRTAHPDELHESERELVRKLLAFPDEVAEAAERRGPHRIAAYALELAQVFTAFYRDCQIVGAEPEAVEDLRLRLSVVTQRTIARALALLGVSAPESM
ncbi:MAG: arginyl-tRNA synthetase [Solirubrobacteraceae bacterium]|nr:arginyl-tRNA synthetase [Solirubrobacteraceae bacterium]